jgi:hypothetical protein
MKKTLLLCALLAATATNMYARRWDFTNWSTETITNLKTHKDWTDDEKGDSKTNVTGDKCLWQTNALASAVDENGYLLANGVVISELEGLKFTTLNAKTAGIALDYGTTTDANAWGPYQGSQYFWLAGASSKIVMQIPEVEPGSTIKIGIESHKPSDPRGVDLYVGSTKLEVISGNASSYPTTYEEYEYLVPESDDETVAVDIKPTNGCHLYYIVAGDDTEKTDDQIRVAYVYDASYSSYGEAKMNGIDNDPIFQNVISNYDGVDIDVNNAKAEGLTTEAFKDSLLNFDVVVLGEGIASGNDYAKSIVDIVNMVPILNLKSFMYKSGVWSWGTGSNPSPAANTITVNEAFLEDELFEGVTIDENNQIQLFAISSADVSGNLIQGYTVTEGTLIAGDDVIATVGGVNAIHRHGATRNAYLLIPISSDNMVVDGETTLTADALTLLGNAVSTLAATKSKVQNASAPTVKQEAGDNVTTVTIASTTADATIYYTLDGSEPTTASTLYTEPFEVTADSTVVNAIAVATGYNQSNTTTATISVKAKLAAPTITVDGAKVTITAAEGTIYYNISGKTDTAKSQVYTEPFEAPFSCTITAFAASDTKLTSDADSAAVTVASDIYEKELEHITFASKEGWGSYSKSAKLLTAFNALVVSDSTLVEVSADSSYYEYTYAPIDSVYTLTAETVNWTLTSKGQQLYIITDHNDALSVEGGATAYGYASVFDNKDYTKYGIGFQNLKHVREDGVANAYLTSGKKYQAPFQVALTFTQALGSGASQTLNYSASNDSVYLYARFEVAVSADGEAWNVVDTLQSAANKMAVRKTTVYEGTDEVYVRVRSLLPLNVNGSSTQKVTLYDVVINGEGAAASAIETINADKVATAAVAAPVYDLMGRRVLKLESGKLYLQGGKKFIMK